jgi:hypothetical protein
MKPSGIALLWVSVLAGCVTAAPAPTESPGKPAVLIANDPSCLSAISSAAHSLTGHPVTLTADAFLVGDNVVLTSVGQLADGRMTRPVQTLQLRLAANGCELKLEGRETSMALNDCRCRPAIAR